MNFPHNISSPYFALLEVPYSLQQLKVKKANSIIKLIILVALILYVMSENIYILSISATLVRHFLMAFSWFDSFLSFE